MAAGRVSKIAVAAWAIVALIVELKYAAVGWPRLQYYAPLVLVLFAALSKFEPRAVALLVAVPYLFPAVQSQWIDSYHVHYTTVWLAAVLGFALPGALGRDWSAPPRLSIPLACWALTTAVLAPIAVLRRIDFHLDLLTRTRTPYESLAGLTFQDVAWLGHVALVIVIGILWFDHLLARPADFIRRWLAWPMAISASLMALVGLYQINVNLRYLNDTVFADLGRATATMFDANVAGIIAALWIGGWLVIAWQTPSRALRVVAALGSLLSWGGVWASASRTAFAAALIITLGAVVSIMAVRLTRRKLVLATLVLAIVMGAATATVVWTAPAAGPVARLHALAVSLRQDPKTALRGLWDRDGYGEAANRMILRFPLFGVGLGAFPELLQEYAPAVFGGDNAQSWYRQQFVETGIVGSLGWMAFVCMFGWWVVSVPRTLPPEGWILRAMLFAFALISLLGVPGQDPAVALTFWTIAAWFLTVRGMPETRPASGHAIAWAATAIAVIASGAGTAVLARSRLRVPERIQRASNPIINDYLYGVWWTEQDAGGEFRWVKREAAVVVDATGRTLHVTVGTNFADLASRPVRAKVWVDGRLRIDQQLTAESPSVSAEVVLPPSERRVFIETTSDRAVYTPEPDNRELALQLRWSFR